MPLPRDLPEIPPEIIHQIRPADHDLFKTRPAAQETIRPVTLDAFGAFDKFAATAYSAYYHGTCRPFDQLDEQKKRTWRRVAAAVLAAEHGVTDP